MTNDLHPYDLWYVQEVHKSLKQLYSLDDVDADRLIQCSKLLPLLSTSPEFVHHDAPVCWAKLIARQNHIQTTKPL